MSGHSHFSSIKHKKEALDKKRGKIFSKISRLISVAAREKGGDPESNPKLRLAIEQAKEVNMPKENITRAIKRGTGELKGGRLEEVVYEAYGPGGIALIIEGITANKNRLLNDLRQILSQHNGKLAEGGSVKWLFDRKGVITINPEENQLEKEEIELKSIDAGAENIFWHDNYLDVYTKPENLEETKKRLEALGIKTESATLDWVAKNSIEVAEKDKQLSEKLFEALDESDDIQEIYSNLGL